MPNSNQNSFRQSTPHIKLFIPGPTEVLPEILDAQGKWMIGHRMPESSDLMASVEPKLQQVFMTSQPVLIAAATGTGFMEGAVRNAVNKKALNCVNGAFSQRMAEITVANGKANEVYEVEWGQAILPEPVAERLASGEFDAVTLAHNETSTGVASPVGEIAKAIRALPNGNEIIIIVDAVSSLSGAYLPFDEWDLDVLFTSSQKAFALPPGLAFCAVSQRAMDKAKTVPNRGFYFDFIDMNKFLQKHQTSATTPISLLYAADVQLDRILAEGVEARIARHVAMRDRTMAWVTSKGFQLFAAPGYESTTVTTAVNNREIDISALNKFLRTRGMIISNGYGNLKGKTFRIAHMGDLHMADLETLFAAMDEYLESTS
ncbi:MAG: alanine--glyoxylate aminotransferase family protein [Chloroflexi bacterium]|nr:alanine--glyoxylate aminotransferase family protein [Ardenticatenaceae bacterium]MBL1129258.1 alanine--glyoxylate aminotransferase family protein [Chloroflexota bacterium]NOG35335.1 alanine--glyoxylate aminotransferase family protein [Chloroflexota bacterium]